MSLQVSVREKQDALDKLEILHHKELCPLLDEFNKALDSPSSTKMAELQHQIHDLRVEYARNEEIIEKFYV